MAFSIRWIILCSFLAYWLSACSAPSVPEASQIRSAALIEAGVIVPPEQIRVAEYLQYYQQAFPVPQNEALQLDLRLGNNQLPSTGGTAYLQIGLQARSAAASSQAPLNLALVLDGSGSMDTPDKFPLLVQGVQTFLQGLRPTDAVTIILYSDTAEAIVTHQIQGDGSWIPAAMAKLRTSNSTNLHDGLLLGLQLVQQHFDIQANNRVILLTDGIANTGVTDPDAIAAAAQPYLEQGIFLSTIGLGLQSNDALLHTLAQRGKGGYTFLADAQDVNRVFQAEAAGFRALVARDVAVEIVPGAGVTLTAVTGVESPVPTTGVRVPLWDLSADSHAVLLATLQVEPAAVGIQPLVTVRVTYTDVQKNRIMTQEATSNGQFQNSQLPYDPLWDLEVYRNVTLQQTAIGLREIGSLAQAGQVEAAWQIAQRLEEQLQTVTNYTQDQQIQETAALLQKYKTTLAIGWQTPIRAQPTLATRPYRSPQPLPDVQVDSP